MAPLLLMLVRLFMTSVSFTSSMLRIVLASITTLLCPDLLAATCKRLCDAP